MSSPPEDAKGSNELKKGTNPQHPGRKSPPREGVGEKGIDPEETKNERTKELATDQSIAARNLLYHPNDASLAVVGLCAAGVGSIMRRLDHPPGDTAPNLEKDEILINMCTRLMADGGTGRLPGFNARLADLVEMNLQTPRPAEYVGAVRLLAADCRVNMNNITRAAAIPGLDGALARQGLLSFMGDLGGLEAKETGFGKAFKGPLVAADAAPAVAAVAAADAAAAAAVEGAFSDADEIHVAATAKAAKAAKEAAQPGLEAAARRVYEAYVAGLCDAQRRFSNQPAPASDREVASFEKDFNNARKATSLKGGVLSAPAHTGDKKGQRAVKSWTVEIRRGLLNQGDRAEEKLAEANAEHKTTLLNASWPSFMVSKAVVQDVVEPVTGHVSGTFGEMVTTMNLFCGTPPITVNKAHPHGAPIPSAGKDQVTAIAALAGAGLITAGFHSAVEIFQPMSTFSGDDTQGSLGPQAVIETKQHVNALRDQIYQLKNPGAFGPLRDHGEYKLSEEELKLSVEELRWKSKSLTNAATKSEDMISLLQGGGGTLATIEVSRVMANHSTAPKELRKLYSVTTRLEELGQRGNFPGLEKARTDAHEMAIAAKSPSDYAKLQRAISKAEAIADQVEAIMTKPNQALAIATRARNAAVEIAWAPEGKLEKALQARTALAPLEEVKAQALREVQAARKEATAAIEEIEAKAAIEEKAEVKEEEKAVKADAKVERAEDPKPQNIKEQLQEIKKAGDAPAPEPTSMDNGPGRG